MVRVSPSPKGTPMAGNDLGSLLGGLLGGGGQGGSSGTGNILGQVLSSVLSSKTGGGGGAGGGSNPLGGLMDMITKSGLVSQEQLDSWVGTGSNQPLDADQVKQAVPDEALDRAAADAGISRDQVADQVAQQLPQLVDKITPDGQVPAVSLEELAKQQNL
ncbi:YidB family protein [Streptomyces sp. NPDC057694]|uniref:YidB family protein n=1 Tax=unclassified Streptomyces TaxID=2593676 RepID=UPI00369D5D37